MRSSFVRSKRTWHSRRAVLPLLCALLLFVTAARAGAPVKYRDLKVYTTSAPDPADAGRIVATMELVNAGAEALEVAVTLDANEAAGYAGGAHRERVEAEQKAAWEFHLQPPEGLKYEVLKGTITFGGGGEAPDRELYVAVHGPDPADFADNRVEKITARAQVVATHAPRTLHRIQQLAKSSKQSTTATAEALVLASEGTSRYQIVFDRLASTTGAEPLTLEQFRTAEGRSAAEAELAEAVLDLQRCVRLRSGAELAVVPAVAPGAGPAIRVRLIPAAADWPHPDAYRLRTENQDVIIEATTDDGLRSGIYGLLTDHLDCHWFMPKQLGEEITPSPDRALRIGALDEMQVPSFFSSAGMSWGTAPRWDRQNRSLINRGRMNFGHAWVGFIDRNLYPFDKFPDMWSRDRAGNVQVFDHGWSHTNLCSTNPEVIRIVAEKINAHFDGDPNAIVASIDPNDLAPMCQCDRCLAVDASYGVTPQDDKQMADRLLHVSKEIHDRLKPEHKKKFLGILAYGFQTRPPKQAVPHPFHVTTVCDFPFYFDHTRPFNDPTSPPNRDFNQIVKGWGTKVKQLGFYDYYGHFDFFGPWGILHKMREDLPAFRDAGGTFIVIESQPNFAMNGLNLYVAGRLAWNLEADVDLLVEEYITKFFGPAAEPMREFFRATERHYALTRPGILSAQRVGARPEFWTELESHLARAEALTRDLPAAEKRFADRIAFHRDGFAFGQRAFHLPARAADLEFVREAKTEIDRMKATYTTADEYWPTMLAPYFYPDLAPALEKLQAAPN